MPMSSGADVAASPSMQITFKLYAMLNEYLPPDKRQGNQMSLDLPEGATVNQAVAAFNLPAKLVHLVLVNGHYIQPAERETRALQAGDVLAIWPPIAGG